MIAVVAALAAAVLPHATQGVHTTQGVVQAHRATVPAQAVVVKGQSFGGVQIGDTPARVRSLWGSDYELCGPCTEQGQTWFYFIPRSHNPVGIAVKFDADSRVVAVFTLGAPFGWRTREGVFVGDELHHANELLGWTGFKVCRGYAAITTRSADGTGTAVYIHGDSVYGFALTAPSENVCQ